MRTHVMQLLQTLSKAPQNIYHSSAAEFRQIESIGSIIVGFTFSFLGDIRLRFRLPSK